MRNALSNDIKVGAYFFSQALTKDEAVEEADYVISKLKPYNVTCPVAIDVEEVNAGSSRQNTLTNEALTDTVIAFCDRIKEAGYTPMIYANSRYFAGKLDMSRLEDYENGMHSMQMYHICHMNFQCGSILTQVLLTESQAM